MIDIPTNENFADIRTRPDENLCHQNETKESWEKRLEDNKEFRRCSTIARLNNGLRLALRDGIDFISRDSESFTKEAEDNDGIQDAPEEDVDEQETGS